MLYLQLAASYDQSTCVLICFIQCICLAASSKQFCINDDFYFRGFSLCYYVQHFSVLYMHLPHQTIDIIQTIIYVLHLSTCRLDRRLKARIGDPILIHKKGSKVTSLHCNPAQPEVLLSSGNDHYVSVFCTPAYSF